MRSFLTNKQIEVLSLRAGGLANKEIASKLNISLGAVHQRINGAKSVLNANNTTNAIARFILYNSITANRVYSFDRLSKAEIADYFERVACDLEIEIFRDALCAEISGHVDFRVLVGEQWAEFVERFTLFINQIQNYKNSKQ